MKSRKFTVIQIISYFRRDSMIRPTIIASDSTAATSGRRSSVSQKKLRMPQVSRKTTLGTIAISVHNMIASAARCSVATSAIRNLSERASVSFARQRLIRNAREGAMATRPCPAMKFARNARHTDHCHKTVLDMTLQGHKRFAERLQH